MAKTDLTNQRQVFVEEYVRSGDNLEAAKKAGYKDTHTLRNQACKLRRECEDEITEELHRKSGSRGGIGSLPKGQRKVFPTKESGRIIPVK